MSAEEGAKKEGEAPAEEGKNGEGEDPAKKELEVKNREIIDLKVCRFPVIQHFCKLWLIYLEL